MIDERRSVELAIALITARMHRDNDMAMQVIGEIADTEPGDIGGVIAVLANITATVVSLYASELELEPVEAWQSFTVIVTQGLDAR